MKNRYEERSFVEIVKNEKTISDIARRLGLKPGHGNRQTIIKYIKLYEINTNHFEYVCDNSKNFKKRNLKDILIKNSTFNTTKLKERLYKEGLKERKCELCGQDENWYGKHMSLILDHKNGINNDNRIENLQIVCPNCNATLPTHCGKNKTNIFKKKIKTNYYCKCGKEINKHSETCIKCFALSQRRAKRPDKETLLKEIEEFGYRGTGKKYGVSDNAIRNWKKKCEM